MWERQLNALMALILAGILWAALGIQFIGKEEPCPLCFLQRLGMLGVASGALMNVLCGVRRLHYGLSLLSALFGGFVALRHICLHICPGSTPFGKPIFGLSLYTWSFIVFTCCVAYITLLFLIFDTKKEEENPLKATWFGQLSYIVVFLVSLTNIFAALWQCGVSACH
jgi:disulfide bond formation protein DsbB